METIDDFSDSELRRRLVQRGCDEMVVDAWVSQRDYPPVRRLISDGLGFDVEDDDG